MSHCRFSWQFLPNRIAKILRVCKKFPLWNQHLYICSFVFCVTIIVGVWCFCNDIGNRKKFENHYCDDARCSYIVLTENCNSECDLMIWQYDSWGTNRTCNLTIRNCTKRIIKSYIQSVHWFEWTKPWFWMRIGKLFFGNKNTTCYSLIRQTKSQPYRRSE